MKTRIAPLAGAQKLLRGVRRYWFNYKNIQIGMDRDCQIEEPPVLAAFTVLSSQSPSIHVNSFFSSPYKYARASEIEMHTGLA